MSITRPPYQAIRETLTGTTACKFRAAYPPPKAGRVYVWLGTHSLLPYTTALNLRFNNIFSAQSTFALAPHR